MPDLPPEDSPDEIWIGPIGPIPIIDEDDPRFEEDRVAWSAATRKAQALHSADELLAGTRDPDWRVRYEAVPRLVARWKDDARTLDVIMRLATDDQAWQVRAAAVRELLEFNAQGIEATGQRALEDEHPDVRWSAQYVLWQSGSTEEPPPGVD